MPTQVFNIAKKGLLDGTIDLNDGTVRAVLVMTNTSVDTQEDVTTVSGFATLDEMNGSGFTWGHGGTGRKSPTVAVAQNDTDDRADVSCTPNPLTWASLGAGARSVQGILFLKVGTTNDNDAIPLFFLNFTPAAANGEDFKVNFDGGATDHVLRLS